MQTYETATKAKALYVRRDTLAGARAHVADIAAAPKSPAYALYVVTLDGCEVEFSKPDKLCELALAELDARIREIETELMALGFEPAAGPVEGDRKILRSIGAL